MEPLRIPDPQQVPKPQLPEPLSLPAPILELPKAEVPSYKQLTFPFSGETFGSGVRVNTSEPQAENQEKKPAPPVIPPITVPALTIPQPLSQSPADMPSARLDIKDRPQLAEATTVTLPGTDIQIPVPKAEIVTAAAVTSAVSVAATLTATSLFKRLVSLFKPVINVAIKRINKLLNKKQLTYGRQKLLLRRHKRLHKVKKGGSYTLPS